MNDLSISSVQKSNSGVIPVESKGCAKWKIAVLTIAAVAGGVIVGLAYLQEFGAVGSSGYVGSMIGGGTVSIGCLIALVRCSQKKIDWFHPSKVSSLHLNAAEITGSWPLDKSDSFSGNLSNIKILENPDELNDSFKDIVNQYFPETPLNLSRRE